MWATYHTRCDALHLVLSEWVQEHVEAFRASEFYRTYSLGEEGATIILVGYATYLIFYVRCRTLIRKQHRSQPRPRRNLPSACNVKICRSLLSATARVLQLLHSKASTLQCTPSQQRHTLSDQMPPEPAAGQAAASDDSPSISATGTWKPSHGAPHSRQPDRPIQASVRGHSVSPHPAPPR